MPTFRTLKPTYILPAVLIASIAAGVFGGPLAPPAGPPASTGRTLTEIEPRTPLTLGVAPGDADSLYKISQPGNYYLTADLIGQAGKRGIEVRANDVTIDLNGFTMRGVAGAKQAIGDHNDETLPHPTNLSVRNGSVVGWPQGGLTGDWFGHVRLDRLMFRANGGSGVALNAYVEATDCSFVGHPNAGAAVDGGGRFEGCYASGNATGLFGVGVGVQMIDCVAVNNQIGISGADALIMRCMSSDNVVTGFEVGGRASVRDCHATRSPTGVYVFGPYTTIEGCTVSDATLNGIRVSGAHADLRHNRFSNIGTTWLDAAIQVTAGVTNVQIVGNSGSDIMRGIDVDGTNCLVVGNSFGGLAVDGTYTYSIAAGNRFGAIVNAPVSAGAAIVSTGQTTAGTFATTDPNANISY